MIGISWLCFKDSKGVKEKLHDSFCAFWDLMKKKNSENFINCCLIDLGYVFSEDRSVPQNTLSFASYLWLTAGVADYISGILYLWKMACLSTYLLMLPSELLCFAPLFQSHISGRIFRTICFGHHGRTLKKGPRPNWLYCSG